MIQMARPSHPGQFVRMEVIEPLGLTVTEAAKALQVTRPALSALLNGRASLSPEMALRIEKSLRPADGYALAHADRLRHCRGPAA
jgi:antitoxin HigA-1